MDQPAIQPSARRHGISDERILYVVRTCPRPIEHPTKEDQILFLGHDRQGVPLEVVAVEDADRRLAVFHAMRMRPGYRKAFEELMRQWQ